jgi:hypothetical protein
METLFSFTNIQQTLHSFLFVKLTIFDRFMELLHHKLDYWHSFYAKRLDLLIDFHL